MENDPDDQETEGDKNIQFDPEVWLQVLLMLNANPREKEELVQRISHKTGLIPENVEKILQSTLELMFQITRSN